jgi:hypothetical protein
MVLRNPAALTMHTRGRRHKYLPATHDHRLRERGFRAIGEPRALKGFKPRIPFRSAKQTQPPAYPFGFAPLRPIFGFR